MQIVFVFFLQFLTSQVNPDLKSVPGIGPAGEKLLVDAGITNTYQLIGKFLMCCSEKKTPQEICQTFYEFLAEEVKLSSYRAGVVTAIAEKVNTMVPGVCDMASLRSAETDIM